MAGLSRARASRHSAAAGRISDPAVCEPKASGTIPAATAAAEPLDESPGVREGSRGLAVGPGVK
ncbi:Uncharacterised protein [Bordetella pertussis]|nr:Uncharacterised protein [Bordetella pertussis]